MPGVTQTGQEQALPLRRPHSEVELGRGEKQHGAAEMDLCCGYFCGLKLVYCSAQLLDNITNL